MGAKTTREIADFVCETGFKNFSPEVVSYTKRICLRHLGMNLAGAMLLPGKIFIKYVEGQGAVREAGILGAGLRTSAEYAAFANGTLSHATELEDVSFPEGQYTCAVFPAVFALGEKLRVSGKEVLEAIALGHEVSARLALACIHAAERGWLNGAVWASVGVAAGAAKMLKLTVKETVMALSLAASQASGIARQTGTGAHLFESGAAGRNGICAATLAKLGFTGNPTILEGLSGLADLVAGEPDFELSEGSRIMEVGMKKYPCCYLMHRNIDGALELIKTHRISYDNVESVEVGLNHTVSLYLKYQQPDNGEDARFSIPHSIAACLLDGHVFLDTYTDQKAQDPKFKEVRQKVKVTVHPEWKPGYFTFPSPLTIKLKDGREYTKLCMNAKGDPTNRLSDGEIMKIYMDCIDFAGTLSREKAERVAEMALALDRLNDISELMNILTFPKK